MSRIAVDPGEASAGVSEMQELLSRLALVRRSSLACSLHPGGRLRAAHALCSRDGFRGRVVRVSVRFLAQPREVLLHQHPVVTGLLADSTPDAQVRSRERASNLFQALMTGERVRNHLPQGGDALCRRVARIAARPFFLKFRSEFLIPRLPAIRRASAIFRWGQRLY